MTDQIDGLCCHCGYPLSEYTAGLRHMGNHTAHIEWYCRQRMRGEIERLRAELAAERERCARIVEEFDYLRGSYSGRAIARAIREGAPAKA